MSLDGFRAGAFKFDAQLAEEFRVPFVFVGFEEAVRFLVGEEVEDQVPEFAVVRDGVVEDPGVGRGGDGVGAFGEARDG